MIRARGLGLRTGQGWVFRDVDLAVPPATLAAVVGPGGSGRSSLLLTLVARMRPSAGDLSLDGADVWTSARSARQARARTAVARLADIAAPEPELTVAEAVTERALIDGLRPRDAHRTVAELAERLGVTLDTSAHVGSLARPDQAVLALLLAALRPADVIVLDDADLGMTTEQERELCRVAGALAATGPAVILATARAEALPEGTITVTLGALPAGRPAGDCDRKNSERMDDAPPVVHMTPTETGATLDLHPVEDSAADEVSAPAGAQPAALPAGEPGGDCDRKNSERMDDAPTVIHMTPTRAEVLPPGTGADQASQTDPDQPETPQPETTEETR